MSDRIEDRAQFDLIRYANCWEDADILCEALEPEPNKRILSIASGGDNTFALLAEGAEVVAADLSEAQLACVELKRAAFRELDYGDMLGFLGVLPAKDRLYTYEKLKMGLLKYARSFWDAHPKKIAIGIIHAGKFENYFKIFRTRILPFIHRRQLIEQLLSERDETKRHHLYESRWNNWRWKLLFHLFFSRFIMGHLGRDPEFFRYVKGSVAEQILTRTRYALTALPTIKNPYLHYILRGNFTPALPRYLRPEFFEAVRGGLERLTLFHGPVEIAARRYGDVGFHGFNLSDIFEYLDFDSSRGIYSALLDAARPHARLAYWNMLVPRSLSEEFPDRVRPLESMARRLSARDLAFFYRAFVIEEAR